MKTRQIFKVYSFFTFLGPALIVFVFAVIFWVCYYYFYNCLLLFFCTHMLLYLCTCLQLLLLYLFNMDQLTCTVHWLRIFFFKLDAPYFKTPKYINLFILYKTNHFKWGDIENWSRFYKTYYNRVMYKDYIYVFQLPSHKTLICDHTFSFSSF